MRPDSSFPLLDWQSFRQHEAVRALLTNIPAAAAFDDWPAPEQWQDLAAKQAVWERLGRPLVFTLEEKPGQRARRKQERALGRSYEASICERQEIPTRAKNLHDFFNALIWLNFPFAKYALHRRAYAIQRDWWQDHGRDKRCPLADRLTCFDEGGIIFDRPAELSRVAVETLLLSRADAEKRAFVQRYARQFTFFGHGMMEVMMKGNVAIHAACILLDPGAESQDQKLARYISEFGAQSPDHGSVNVAWLIDNGKSLRGCEGFGSYPVE